MNSERLDPLRLNVGFLLHQSVGFSRIFEFDVPSVTVGGDLNLSGLRGDLRLTRTAQGLYGQGRMEAWLPLECSRCLDTFEQTLVAEIGDLFVYPPEKADDPLLAIPETGMLDLNPLFRETFVLAIPLQPICQSECKGLCPDCGGNRNVTPCEHQEDDIDPRLEPLRNLLSNS
ncbi:MAG: DUF177 domain-containing protein [Anaerolineales bacterium]